MLNRINQALLKISKFSFGEFAEPLEVLKFINETASETLGISRCSIWIYNRKKDAIVCTDLYERDINKHSNGVELKAKDFPLYFQYLSEERTLAAHDARTNPSTREFTEVYLKPLNIFSMLDAPFRINGVLSGVICCEVVGEKRTWLKEEEVFAGALADYIGRAFESAERIEALKRVEAQKLVISEKTKLAALGQLAGGISHEINNPLQILMGNSDRLLELCEDKNLDREEISACCKSISSTIDKISNIIVSLKSISNNDVIAERSLVNVHEVLTETMTYVTDNAEMEGVDCQLDSRHEDVALELNSASVSQVIVNLVTNSIQAIRKLPDPWVKVVSRIASDSQGAAVIQISVTDSGNGIPLEIQKNLMKPFFSTKGENGGSGLGLNLSKSIIEKLGGRLFLDTDCKNTRFVIEFPIPETSAIAA